LEPIARCHSAAPARVDGQNTLGCGLRLWPLSPRGGGQLHPGDLPNPRTASAQGKLNITLWPSPTVVNV